MTPGTGRFIGLLQMIKKLTFIIAAMLFASAHAQWTEPVRISHGLGLLGPQAVAVGDTLHVVASGTTDIYYLKSSDNGQTWTDPTIPIPDSFYGSQMPYISYSNGYLHLIWKAYFDGSRNQICHMKSSDGGVSWSQPRRLFDNESSFLKYPRIAIKGDSLFASCVISSKLLTFASFDNGETWEDSVEVENGPVSFDHPPCILYSQGRNHLVYQVDESFDTLGIEICYRYSDDYGQTWSDRQYLSTPEHHNQGKDAQGPSAYADSAGNIMALWFDYEYGSECGVTGDILGRISRDNGETWLPVTRLTYTQTGSRSTCLVLNNRLYAIWQDDYWLGCMDHKLTYSESVDWGVGWSDPEIISGPMELDEYEPFLLYNESLGDMILHCVYRRKLQEGNRDLYYIRSQEFTEIRGETGTLLPENLILRTYPNPFNSTVTIDYKNQEGGDIEIEIYNLLGQRINSFTTEGAKEGRIVWDARNALGNRVSSGIYFARARASRNSSIIKLLYLK